MFHVTELSFLKWCGPMDDKFVQMNKLIDLFGSGFLSPKDLDIMIKELMQGYVIETEIEVIKIKDRKCLKWET